MIRTEPSEASAFTKFQLLMWKNFLQQWRHRIQTVVEILLPVVTMSLILILRWQMEPTQVDTLTYPPIPSHSLNFSTPVLIGMNITELSVAYSPRSPELDDVIRSAITNLIVQNIPIFIPIIIEMFPINVTLPDIPPGIIDNIPPDIINSTEIIDFIKNLIRVDAYDNSTELRQIYNSEDVIRKVIAAVEFEDGLLGTTQLPINVSYSLRFPERLRLNTFYNTGGRSWRTDLVFPIFDTSPGPRFPYSWQGGNNPGYVNEMFIALQNAISLEIISRITGEDVRNFTIDLQRYPHPPYVNDMATDMLALMLPTILVVSYSYTAVNIVRAVTSEKELQLKESMKIMGLPTWLHWTAWFCKQFVFLLISSSLIVVLLKVNWFTNEEGFSDYAVVTNTPWTVLLFFIVLYMMAMIFFCFMISSFFSKASTAALFMGIIWFLNGIPVSVLNMDVNVSPSLQTFSCLLINSAVNYGFQLMLGRESSGGVQWGEFMTSPATGSGRFLFGHVIIMLAVDCVLYMLIALYLEQVLPGPFGTPKPWYFPFTVDFWCQGRTKINGAVFPPTDHEVLQEADPIGHSIGVQISNLTKVFGSNIAVDHLSLNIYDDQITVLLGHNGAGKSTTISMLTGNLESTHGSVVLAGYDITRQPRMARSHLGLCPQHNVLFNELTVKEHLQFFARLKGFKGKELEEDIESLIEKLELQEKRDYQAKGLSGGQKRRLCVGIALSGAAKVVLLDEPTSGMDPASRRALWDLLQKEKKSRSMILTTHFMDEADYLGDRVAIMARGRLQCVGSPHFLKRHHGVGYTLVVVKDEGFDYDKCVHLINTYIPNTPIKDDRGSEITFHLFNEHASEFEIMLDDFEKNIDEIKFKNYGLIATTLEDVFMKLGADMNPVSSVSDDGTATVASTVDSNEQLSSDPEDYSVKLSKSRRLLNHVLAIWMKLWLVWSRSWGFLFMQLVVPVVLINSTLGVVEFILSFRESVVSRNLTLTEGFSSTETLVNFVGTSSAELGARAALAYMNLFRNSDVPNMALTVVDNNQTLQDYYLDRATVDSNAMRALRHSMLIGATFDHDSATAWFSNFGYHDVAISLNAVHTALLRARNAVAQLNVYNFPLEASYLQQRDLQMMIQLVTAQVSNGIGTSVAIISAVFVMFYIRERVSGAKLLQQAAGLQPIVMWGSAFLVDWLWFLVCCISILISCFAFNVLGLSTFIELARLYLCIIVYGAAMLPMNYLFSLTFKGPTVGFVVVFFVNLVLGMMGSQIVEALATPMLDTKDVADGIDAVLQLFPMYSLVTAVRSLNRVEMMIYSCKQGCDFAATINPNMGECTMEVLCEITPSCCIPENSSFHWEEPGVLRYLVMMIISGIIFWIVLFVLEYRLLERLFRRKKVPPPVDPATNDKDVEDEEFHATHIDKTHLAQHGLVTKRLSKYYGKNLAVNQISFSVNDAECFGLLGVNGAGKTSTFKMLMGDESISSGEAYVSGHSVQNELTQVYKSIGYCPQFDALFPELTGRETLRLFSLVRGLPAAAARHQAAALAHALAFHNHLDKKVSAYSGGTKRKLNTAIALLGWSRLVFVDEPTTGVDPAAKRNMWRALRSIQNSGRGVLLTSHSMEECEALCSRLTIMVNGRFQCLGTPQHLKDKFSQGFTLTIKLGLNEDSTIESATEAIKQYVNTHFVNPKIMEEYHGVLTFYLQDTSMAWSKMFGVMERAKRDLSVEYYSISQTTLEQIFLQFTKYQREGLSK